MQRATIQVSERIDLPVAPSFAWSVLDDTEVVARCIPGALLEGQRDDGTYAGSISIALGPTAVTFVGDLDLLSTPEERYGKIVARGQEKRGTKARSTAEFRVLDGADTSSCLLVVDGSFEVTGPLATFARAGGPHLVKKMIKEFVANLAALSTPVPAADASAEPDLIPSTQVEKSSLWVRLKHLFARLRGRATT